MIDAQLIEQLDRKRYRAILWMTIGFALFFGCLIAAEFIPRDNTVPLILPALIGFAILIGGLVAHLRNQKKIKSNPDLKKSLNNEMIKHYEYKSYKWGFVAAYIAVLILYILEPRWEALTVKLVCLIMMYLPFMTFCISQLIYLRR